MTLTSIWSSRLNSTDENKPHVKKETAENPGDYGPLPKIKGMKKKLLEGN